MRRPFLALLLLAASCASPSGPRRASTGELQPLDVGLTWTYEADGLTQIRTVRGIEKVGRFDCRVLEARTGDTVLTWWVRSDREGLRLFRASDGSRTVEFDDPPVLLPAASAPGTSWSFEEHHGPLTLAVEGKYEADEDLPFGDATLRCARVRMIKRAAGRVVIDQVSWYARDVGLVRMTAVEAGEGGDTTTALLLRSHNFGSEGVEAGRPRRR